MGDGEGLRHYSTIFLFPSLVNCFRVLSYEPIFVPMVYRLFFRLHLFRAFKQQPPVGSSSQSLERELISCMLIFLDDVSSFRMRPYNNDGRDSSTRPTCRHFAGRPSGEFTINHIRPLNKNNERLVALDRRWRWNRIWRTHVAFQGPLRCRERRGRCPRC